MTERDPQTYQIIGAAMEVHRHLGAGFLEPVYQDAFAIELSDRSIPFERELCLPVSYKAVSWRVFIDLTSSAFSRSLLN